MDEISTKRAAKSFVEVILVTLVGRDDHPKGAWQWQIRYAAIRSNHRVHVPGLAQLRQLFNPLLLTELGWERDHLLIVSSCCVAAI